MKYIVLVLLALFLQSCADHPLELRHLETNIESSFRGLSVVTDRIAWVSGSNGWVGMTENGGESWSFTRISGFEQSGFRSLYAFDSKNAIIANAGSPAHILRTEDGGKSWRTVYTNTHPDAFFDGMDFWNDNEGVIYGDPIDGKMLLLKTQDGGKSWNDIASSPRLQEGEASFAASGTGIRCFGQNEIIISTGGKVSRLWSSSDQGENWESTSPPIIQGGAATGIFSFAKSSRTMVLVGGDYTVDTLAIKHNIYSMDEGQSWNTPTAPTRGYRECVEFIANNVAMATGPGGTDISFDGGKNWKSFSEDGFHVVRKARKGTRILLAGSGGKVSTLEKR
ncbi:MAG: YCF48-related protein [Cyclobacteriaceae bacterium]